MPQRATRANRSVRVVKEIIENATNGVVPSVRELETASRYFWEIGLPALETAFPNHIDRIAAGLVAAGSDYTNNDDEISRDSDWGPRFQVYLTRSDYAEIGDSVQALLNNLPNDFYGVRCYTIDGSANRVFSVDGFFREMTSNGVGQGFEYAPESALDWLKIPEPCLFEISRGQVFYDPQGDFTARRRGFTSYYPNDVWHKRIAAALVDFGTQGHKNLICSLERRDFYTAEMSWWRFTELAMRLGFLLNRRYYPSQKWLYREFCRLPKFSAEVANLLWEGQCDACVRPELVHQITAIYNGALRELNLTQEDLNGTFDSFVKRAEDVSASITDPDVASLAVWVDTVVS